MLEPLPGPSEEERMAGPHEPRWVVGFGRR